MTTDPEIIAAARHVIKTQLMLDALYEMLIQRGIHNGAAGVGAIAMALAPATAFFEKHVPEAIGVTKEANNGDV